MYVCMNVLNTEVFEHMCCVSDVCWRPRDLWWPLWWRPTGQGSPTLGPNPNLGQPPPLSSELESVSPISEDRLRGQELINLARSEGRVTGTNIKPRATTTLRINPPRLPVPHAHLPPQDAAGTWGKKTGRELKVIHSPKGSPRPPSWIEHKLLP